jgi:hypothetical protein
MQALSKWLINVTCSLVLIGCSTMATSGSESPSHPVATIDQVQARDCTYLYSTNLTETGFNPASATANAIYQLKNQAMVTNGNAIRVTNVYPTTRYEYGYTSDASNVYVEVYNCPMHGGASTSPK